MSMLLCTHMHTHTISQLFVVASIISLAFIGHFYSFCLLYIIVNNDILQRVLRSVTKNGKIHLSGSK